MQELPLRGGSSKKIGPPHAVHRPCPLYADHSKNRIVALPATLTAVGFSTLSTSATHKSIIGHALPRQTRPVVAMPDNCARPVIELATAP